MASLFDFSNQQQTTRRHNRAVLTVKLETLDLPSSLLAMLRGWEGYAMAHQAKYGEFICDNYVFGPAWESLGLTLRELLNGETGGLQCGKVDAFILLTLKEHGHNPEDDSTRIDDDAGRTRAGNAYDTDGNGE